MSATAEVEQAGEVYVVNTRRAVRVNHETRLAGSRVTASDLGSRKVELLVMVGDLVPLAVWEKTATRRMTASPADLAMPEDQAVDESALEVEARLQELRERRQELALDSLGDPKAAKELATVEADLLVAERTLERAALARQEQAKRAEQAEQDAAAAQRAAGMQRARELQAEREKLVKRIDRAAATLAKELKALDLLSSEQGRALAQAGWQTTGWQAAWPKPFQIGGAITYALTQAGVPSGMVPLQAASTGQLFWGKPLAELDPRLVEPAEEKR